MFKLVYVKKMKNHVFDVEFRFDSVNSVLTSETNSNECLDTMLKNYNINQELNTGFNLFGTVVNRSANSYLVWPNYINSGKENLSIITIPNNLFSENYKIYEIPININYALYTLRIYKEYKTIFNSNIWKIGKFQISSHHDENILTHLMNMFNQFDQFSYRHMSTLIRFIIKKIDLKIPKEILNLIWSFI